MELTPGQAIILYFLANRVATLAENIIGEYFLTSSLTWSVLQTLDCQKSLKKLHLHTGAEQLPRR